jgi:hypothetical protein
MGIAIKEVSEITVSKAMENLYFRMVKSLKGYGEEGKFRVK